MPRDGDNKSGDAKAVREAKLAQALRDNLRRRKASGGKPPGRSRPESPPDGESS